MSFFFVAGVLDLWLCLCLPIPPPHLCQPPTTNRSIASVSTHPTNQPRSWLLAQETVLVPAVRQSAVLESLAEAPHRRQARGAPGGVPLHHLRARLLLAQLADDAHLHVPQVATGRAGHQGHQVLLGAAAGPSAANRRSSSRSSWAAGKCDFRHGLAASSERLADRTGRDERSANQLEELCTYCNIKDIHHTHTHKYV